MPGDVGVFTRIMTWPTQCMPEGVDSLHTHTLRQTQARIPVMVKLNNNTKADQ